MTVVSADKRNHCGMCATDNIKQTSSAWSARHARSCVILVNIAINLQLLHVSVPRTHRGLKREHEREGPVGLGYVPTKVNIC